LILGFLIFSDVFVLAADISTSPVKLMNSKESFLEIGKLLFRKFCAHCHGRQGDGDGFNAKFLDKDPVELSSPEFLAKRSNEKLFRVISEGGARVKKSHLMPVFGHTLSEMEIWALVVYIRHLGGAHVSVSIPENINFKRPIRPALTLPDIISFTSWFIEEGKKKEQRDKGKLLVMNKKSCLGCHQLNEEGGRVGPNLSRSSFNYKPEWIYAWISNPQTFRPDTKMPNLGLESDEARAITAFLASLRPEEEDAVRNKTSIDWKQYLSIKGNSVRGKKIFNDTKGTANCAKCHLVKGQGGSIGPELSIVGTSRTREFLLESILDPNAVITSGYETILILTKDRKLITGIKKGEDETGFEIVDKNGKDRHIPRNKIKKFKVQKVSTMPENFKDLLKTQEIADLLAYLNKQILPNVTFSIQ